MRGPGLVSYSTASLLLFLLPSSYAQVNNGDFPTLSTATGSGAAAATSAGYDGLTDAPTVTDANAVPTYPPPTIPPTAEAPFMQKSAYPQGTVFICFGAALGFMLVCVLLWHAWVAWSIHRGLQRAKKGYASLAPQGPPPEPGLLDRGVEMLRKSNLFYTQPDSGSMISMSLLHNEEQRAARVQPSHGFAPDKKSLFFSPTASSGFPATGLGVKRDTAYMPSGYYAAGGPDRTAMQTSTTDQNLPSRSSTPNYFRRGAGEATVNGPGRGQSPGLAERLLAAQQSTASLATTPGSRAPSMYLDDMYDATPVSHERGL